MKADLLAPPSISQVAQRARDAEQHEFARLWIGETNNAPFLHALRALDATEHLEVGTAVAIAFARSPMTVAYEAWDLAAASNGRFTLGLGTQVRAHVERRFSMPWSAPAARLREYVLAVRSIWHSWQTGEPLRFEGAMYRHTLMTPFFTPPAHGHDPPKIMLAGTQHRTVEVAGEVADGFIFHPFTTYRYLAEVAVPAAARGRAGSDDPAREFVVCGPVFVAAGDRAQQREHLEIIRKQLAFYASTPAYRAVLAFHGWEDVQPLLTAMSKDGRWDEMASCIDDDILREFTVVGTAPEVANKIVERYAGVADRVTLHAPEYTRELTLIAASLREAESPDAS